MRNQFFNVSAAALAMALVSVSVPNVTWAQRGGGTLAIQNDSAYDIRQVFISSAFDPDWGRDVLGTTILLPGREFDLTHITPGLYDVKTVDEDGDSCTLYGVNLYGDRSWDITTDSLLSCEIRS